MIEPSPQLTEASLVCVMMSASAKRAYGNEVSTRKGTAALDSLRTASRCTSPGTLLLSSDGVEREVVLAPGSAMIRYWPRNRRRDIWCTRFYLLLHVQMDRPEDNVVYGRSLCDTGWRIASVTVWFRITDCCGPLTCTIECSTQCVSKITRI